MPERSEGYSDLVYYKEQIRTIFEIKIRLRELIQIATDPFLKATFPAKDFLVKMEQNWV